MDDKLKARLCESIAYALSRSLPSVPRRGAWKGLHPDMIRITADAVVHQLEISGYKIEKEPPRGSVADMIRWEPQEK
jgi:hypothetical protein